MTTSIFKMTLAASVCLMATGAAAEGELKLFAWQDLFSPELIAEFEDKTGYKVTYDSYDSDETLETRLLTGDTGYDVIVPSATPFLARQIKAGAVEKIDKTLVPNFDNQDQNLLRLMARADPGLEYAVIGGWGTTGMGLNVTKVRELLPDAPLDSYDLIFKPEYASKLSECGVSLVDSATDVVPIALNYLGLDPESQDPADLNKAMELLDGIRPYVEFDKGRMMTDTAQGNICASIAWSGDIVVAGLRAAEAGQTDEIRYVMPKEGTMAWFTAIAIPRNAPNPDAANAFLDFTLEPSVAARMTLNLGYANGVPASRDMLPPEMAASEVVFPSEDVLRTLFVAGAVEDTLTRQRNRAWTKFRSGE
ncbi:Putrescine-binding periplasmic protein precursor [Thalassovita gelatinovora]|uniref:Putrescine-binding periplasmic protein n=1 Tax=Thalassovita gelatinovora TaxID=53501 RepID=A0A0P1FTR6_THAGE|nr:extracellular solute-binding protein [Thalassovita gelatinovora]QIZ81296.1 extracellular solute-binding protein [Thalassovita gelatinovora]CUH64550.1 Putrescine-binding periplasmic protein precursor [Thalassovita gelatinovora]SEP96327.1 putrescine transport system substrate-binding protein [Thalassovita gelatinovora]